MLGKNLPIAQLVKNISHEGGDMKLLKTKMKRIRNSQSGQGMTEYILLIVIVIAVAVVFKEPIKNAVKGKMESVGGEIQGFKVD
jgi:Flp pilus assembly pilin Flp